MTLTPKPCDTTRYLSGCGCARCARYAVVEARELRRLDERDRRRASVSDG